MNQVTFYELAEQSGSTQEAMHNGAFKLIYDLYKSRKWVSVLAADQKHAEAFDEALWQLPAEQFIPHNLSGEGPAQGTPVEITWQTQKLNPRHTVINMAQSMIDTSLRIQHVIDFVPFAEAEKQAARERYKQYKQAGCQMQFVKL
ncbi:DNA polymerase III subunit chi [Glaciecola sp. KUL10]|jgi:DNA polymerase-3 subunit chi|uniref:DNA polymerase III subunit chi n=1 Tax=Glaciecola sp. (strain KUL10) TaxID=2161813 RepID=UPI000D788BB0|nr:DNA polymerase III subunit chi [Glaciecola sp. KUL10]GBL04922.1 DNA polymerase III chi subunit [Glaciecola sp. KUL10]